MLKIQNRINLARSIKQINQPETAADRRTICDAILNNASKNELLAHPRLGCVTTGVRLMIIGARI